MLYLLGWVEYTKCGTLSPQDIWSNACSRVCGNSHGLIRKCGLM